MNQWYLATRSSHSTRFGLVSGFAFFVEVNQYQKSNIKNQNDKSKSKNPTNPNVKIQRTNKGQSPNDKAQMSNKVQNPNGKSKARAWARSNVKAQRTNHKARPGQAQMTKLKGQITRQGLDKLK
jgi:hypothetical protein